MFSEVKWFLSILFEHSFVDNFHFDLTANLFIFYFYSQQLPETEARFDD